MASKRLMTELEQLHKTHDVEIVDDNLHHWHIALHGPDSTPYFGYTFLIDIVFPQTYPFDKPMVTFQTPIYHLNISRKGAVCLDILSNWKPKNTVAEIMVSINNILSTPNIDNPLEPLIASEYLTNRSAYEKRAKDMAEKYAV